MDVNFTPIAKEFIHTHDIQIADNAKQEEIIEHLAKHLDALVYNITSLVAFVTMIEDKKKIEPKHLVAAQSYIAHKCIGKHASKKFAGGAKALDLKAVDVPIIEEFTHSKYKIQMRVDMRSMIHHIVQSHALEIGSGAFKGILKILHAHMECLLDDIKHQEPLTMKKLEYIMSMRRHSVFH